MPWFGLHLKMSNRGGTRHRKSHALAHQVSYGESLNQIRNSRRRSGDRAQLIAEGFSPKRNGATRRFLHALPSLFSSDGSSRRAAARTAHSPGNASSLSRYGTGNRGAQGSELPETREKQISHQLSKTATGGGFLPQKAYVLSRFDACQTFV